MEVEAGGRRVPVRHALERHIVSFLERVLSDDLQGDVLCGVCAQRNGRQVCEMKCARPLQLSGETAEISRVGLSEKKKNPGAIILLMTNLYAAEPAESQ